MTSRGMGWTSAAMLLVSMCAAKGQSSPEPLPSLPPAPTQKPLILPKSSGPIPLYASHPGDAPPPLPAAGPSEEDAFCTTPSDISYRTDKPQTAEMKKASADYVWAIHRQIWQSWKVPREINDPWLRAAQVRLKFEILADGRLNDPVIMMTSGRASYDRRALEAVKDAAPFPPPPEGARPFRMCYRFGYNMNPNAPSSKPVDVFAKKPAQP